MFSGKIEQMIRYVIWRSGAATGIVIGISGGLILLYLRCCCRALGGERVYGYTLTTSITRDEDIHDAADLAGSLGMHHQVMSIEPVLSSYRQMPGYVEDPYLLGNIMARTRMVILYYHANREHRLVCGIEQDRIPARILWTKCGDNAADFQPILHLQNRNFQVCA